MKLKDILKKVGENVVREVVPGGGLLIDALNAFKPGIIELDKNATGEDITSAIENSFAPDVKKLIYEKEFDVRIETIQQEHSSIRAMLESEEKSRHTTRPFIAKGSFWAYTILVSVVTLYLGFAVVEEDAPLSKLNDSWLILLSLYAPYMTVIYAYFGILKSEHQNRLNAANGKLAVNGLNILQRLFNRTAK